MTKPTKDTLLDLEGATTDAQSAAIALQVLVNAFFPTTTKDYPIWAHACDATAFQYIADDIKGRIDHVQDLVQAACEDQEAQS